MIKNLYMKDKSGKIIVAVDDLKFDGKNLIVPSYWNSVLIDYLDAANCDKMKPADREDFNIFKKFLCAVEDYKDEAASRGN
jgi:hypothetical protein